jgi:hypothetical protein
MSRYRHSLARATRDSKRRGRVKHAIARLRARETDRRKDAAKNIAAGHAVTARGGDGVTRPVNREPQLLLQSA